MQKVPNISMRRLSKITDAIKLNKLLKILLSIPIKYAWSIKVNGVVAYICTKYYDLLYRWKPVYLRELELRFISLSVSTVKMNVGTQKATHNLWRGRRYLREKKSVETIV